MAIGRARNAALTVAKIVYSQSNPVRRLVIITSDITLCTIATIVSFILRTHLTYVTFQGFVTLLLASSVLWLSFAKLIGVYDSMMRYFDWQSMKKIALCCGAMSAVLLTIVIFYQSFIFPRTLSIIQPLVLFIFLSSSRVFVAYLYTTLYEHTGIREKHARGIIVYGMGHAMQQALAALRSTEGFEIVAIVDSDNSHGGRNVGGHRVHNDRELESLLSQQSPSSILISPSSLSRRQRFGLIDRAKAVDPQVEILTLPSVEKIVDGSYQPSELRSIVIEDLLGRRPVEPLAHLLTPIAGSKILVTGAGGSIGSELCRQIVRSQPTQIVLADKSEFGLYKINEEITQLVKSENIDCDIIACLIDITNPILCDDMFSRYRPERVFHAAAYKHVPLIEANVVSGVRNNIRSTSNLLAACERYDVELMALVSTDKAVRPTNTMGASKRVCELMLQEQASRHSGTRYCSVRFGNVLGSSGSVVPKFKEQIVNGGPITLTHGEVTRYFMTIPEAASLVLQASAMGSNGDVFLLDMGEPIRIGDLARTMIELSGLSVCSDENPSGDIRIVETGLRPGEKLYEELLLDASAQPTDHERIVKAQEPGIETSKLKAALNAINKAIDEVDEDAINSLLSAHVAGFRDVV